MPLATAICGLPVLAALLSLPCVAVVVHNPDSGDAYAVLGAIIASILALIEARKKDRELGHTLSVFLGSASMGSIVPGLVYHAAVWRGWVPRDSQQLMPWQVWAFGGLLFGLNGWGLLHVANAVLRQRAKSVRLALRGGSTRPRSTNKERL